MYYLNKTFKNIGIRQSRSFFHLIIQWRLIVTRICHACELVVICVLVSRFVYADDVRPFAILHDHPGAICSVSFSPDGKLLVSGDAEGKVSVWNSGTRQLIAVCSAGDWGKGNPTPIKGVYLERNKVDAIPITSVAFSKDGQMLAALDRAGLVQFWTLGTEPNRIIRSKSRFVHAGLKIPLATMVSFNADGSTLAASALVRNTILIDVKDARISQELSCHKDTKSFRLSMATFSPDGRTIAEAGSDSKTNAYTVHLWDVAAGRRRATLESSVQEITPNLLGDNTIVITIDSMMGASKHPRGVVLWNLSGDVNPRVLELSDGTVRSLAYSPDRTLLAVGDCRMVRIGNTRIPIVEEHCYISLFDVVSGTQLNMLSVPIEKTKGVMVPSNVDSLTFSPDGRTIACAGTDGRVMLYSVTDCLPPPKKQATR